MRVLVAMLTMGPSPITYGQGTVFFANLDNRAVNAPVYLSDGATKLSGPQFLAELLAGPAADNIVQVATTGFLTGDAAGYFIAGTEFVNSVAAGSTAWVQVDVWNSASGASFLQARASGLPNSWWQSSVFPVQTGNVPSGAGPTPPGPLTGLGTSPVFLNGVPEPSALAIACLGATLTLLRFRRWKRT